MPGLIERVLYLVMIQYRSLCTLKRFYNNTTTQSYNQWCAITAKHYVPLLLKPRKSIVGDFEYFESSLQSLSIVTSLMVLKCLSGI